MDNQYSQKIDPRKPDGRKSQSTEDEINSAVNVLQAADPGSIRRTFSPGRFLIITIGGIFLAEVVAMIVIYGFPSMPYYLQVLVDASIMALLIFPLVYYISLKPLLLYIEKHQRLENALRQSEERFALAYRSNPAALSITQVKDGRFIEVNESFLRLYGYARNEVINFTSDELNLYPNFEEREKLNWLLLKQRAVDDFEMTTRIKSGELRNISVSTEAIELAGEVYILAVASDITEQKQAETRLRRVNHALNVLKKCNQVLVRAENEIELLHRMCEIIVNVGGYRMAWVGFAEQDQGRSVRPVAQFGFEDGYLGLAQITWADDEHGRGPTGTAIRESVAQVNQNFKTDPKMEPWRGSVLSRGYQSSIALPLKDGKSAFGALTIYSASPDAFDEEEVNLLNELADDLAFGITVLRVRLERDQAQEQVREMALFPALNPDAVMRVDARGRIVKTNPAADQMGFYIGAQLTEILPDFLELDLAACIATGGDQQVQLEAQLGEQVFLWTVRGVPDLGLAFLYGKDITHRKQVEVAIRQLSRIVEQTEDTVVVTNPKGVVEYVNPAFERLTGFTKEEALGKTPNILKSGLHDGQFYNRLWKTILDGEVFLGEIANRKKNGELFYEVKTITPLRDEQGSITHFVATGKDITTHKLDEEKLRKAYDELELRVQERTIELRMAISELKNEIAGRKKVEEALRISEMDLENAQAVARIGSWKWNLEKGEIILSDEMYRIFSIDKNSYTGRLGDIIASVIHPDDLHLVLPSNAQLLAEKKPIEYRIILPDKSIRHIWAKSGEAIVDDKGKPIFLTGIAQDITERKQIEEKIQAANKELMRFNNAMVGRELRMIELKKEVNELCEINGQPSRYSLDFEKEKQ